MLGRRSPARLRAICWRRNVSIALSFGVNIRSNAIAPYANTDHGAGRGDRGASEETIGLVLGFAGVLAFSVSLPATRVAVRELGVLFVSFGRAVVAGALAIAVLVIRRVPVPARRLWPQLVLVVGGVVIGFPAFTGLALQRAPAGHGAVVIGLLPAITAGLGVFRVGAAQSRRHRVRRARVAARGR